MHRRYRMLAVTFAFSMLWNISCRTRERNAEIAGIAPRVLITFVNLDDAHKEDPSLGYRIRCNNDGEWIPGKYVEGQKAEFFVKDLKVNNDCAVKIFNLAPPADMKFIAEEGLMYAAEDVSISSDAKGQLEGTAILASDYQFENQGYKLTANVRFPDQFPPDANYLRARLICKPTVGVPSEVMTKIDKKAKTGQFTFLSGFRLDLDYTCSSLQVQRGDSIDFYASIQDKINLSASAAVDLPEQTLVAVDVSKPEGITVITQSGGSCAEDEIFVLDTRRCEKK
jgi:hypothetical protein